MAIVQLDSKHGACKDGLNHAFDFDAFFFHMTFPDRSLIWTGPTGPARTGQAKKRARSTGLSSCYFTNGFTVVALAPNSNGYYRNIIPASTCAQSRGDLQPPLLP